MQRRLFSWYRRERRSLPWRETRDPYRIWVSEIMLQQTRVAVVIPYYERFLARFPNVAALARATDAEVLSAWAGLGYYSRARNLHRAAREIAARGAFPRDYESIRALPGVGAYTAAAVSSIAFGAPRAAVDGNVVRVLARLSNDAAATVASVAPFATALLPPARAGDWNQALMELGAVLCTPRDPRCTQCPWEEFCEGRRQGSQDEVPARLRPARIRAERTLLVVRRNGRVLMGLARSGFWELPEKERLPACKAGAEVGTFRHSITNHNYRFAVRLGTAGVIPRGFRWMSRKQLELLPVSTTTRKALSCLK